MTVLDSYYNDPADEESRQHYATVRIQEMQRSAIELRREVLPLDFSESRLRDDLLEGAA